MSLCLVFGANHGLAQELSVLGGYTSDAKSGDLSYMWQLDYRDGLAEHYAYSVSYLNEGHLPGHHRDGYAAQLWVRSNAFGRRLSLAAGVGPYFYFDTMPSPTGSDKLNDTGLGAIVSISATWHTESRWLFQVRGNWVGTVDSIDTLSTVFGVGYQLDPAPSRKPARESSPACAKTTNNEITAFIGETSVFNGRSTHSMASSVEYRRGLWRYVDWTVAWLYEGDNEASEMNGLATQLWAAKAFFDDHLALSIGAGPYIAMDRLHDHQIRVSGIDTMSAAYRFHPHWGTRVSWNRIITSYNRDADVWLAGLTYRF